MKVQNYRAHCLVWAPDNKRRSPGPFLFAGSSTKSVESLTHEQQELSIETPVESPLVVLLVCLCEKNECRSLIQSL